jgi:antitoxin (DNA-binding transcriptional repressor) of toxin-antitoxin stability system
MQQQISVTEARGKFGELVDTIVLMKCGKPAAAIVPFELLEHWQKASENLYSVIDEIQEHNRNLDMSDDKLLDFVNEAVHEVRLQR